MIKNSNNADLERFNVNPKYYFFWQLWKELTEQKTMDSYQFKVLNTLSALQELVKVIDFRLENKDNTYHNVEECKSEVLEIVRNDRILDEYYSNIKSRLLSSLGGKCDNETKQRTLRVKIVYYYDIISTDYVQQLASSLHCSICENKAVEITSKTRQFVSCCVWQGWSTRALKDMVDILSNTLEDDKWNEFVSSILVDERDEYHLFFPITVRANIKNGQTNEEALRNVRSNLEELGIQILSKDQIAEQYPYEIGVSKGYHAIIKNKSFDFYSASHKAINAYGAELNILSFYNLITGWDTKELSWWSVNHSQQRFIRIKALDLYRSYNFIDSENKIFKYAKQINKGDKYTIYEKLRCSYGHANMGNSAYSYEEKFLNIWVALESLSRTRLYDNIIMNVIETVPPALCIRYIYGHFRNFVEDCVRCNIDFIFKDVTINILQPDKENLVKDVIGIFKDDNLYSELVNKCIVNDLLKHRCSELKTMFMCDSNMFKRIIDHHANIKHHLCRLYRIRNEISHNGFFQGDSLMSYTDHLIDYLYNFVSIVIRYSEEKGGQDIETIFEMIKDDYKEFCHLVSNTKFSETKIVLKDLYNTGIISLI